jgi:hypothetical protein
MADAEIFGCSTVGYLDVPDDDDSAGWEEWKQWVQSAGVLKIRQKLLQVDYFAKLFKCYFCCGFLIAPVAHLFCYYFFGSSYFLYHPNSLPHWVCGVIAASLIGAVGAFITDKRIVGR